MRTTIFLTTLLALLCPAGSAHAQADRPSLTLVHRSPSYFAVHNQLVMHAFLRFSTAEEPERQANRLEALRERDHLQLFSAATPNDTQAGYGVALLGAMTILAAHAPSSVRAIFDGPVHLGPAIFDGGGLGAGIGGRFYL